MTPIDSYSPTVYSGVIGAANWLSVTKLINTIFGGSPVRPALLALFLSCSSLVIQAQGNPEALAATKIANPAAKSGNWSFAVSGDSRNCGDIAMSAIAQGATSDHAAFYWHLGDFRAIYDFDQDYKQAAGSGVTIDKYESEAWNDFIQNQLSYFGSMPIFLAMGNHESIVPKTRDRFIQQFNDWLATPVLTAQRLKDDANDHLVKTYYHWIQGGVDFVTMDNATADQFDDNQMGWFEKVLSNAASNAAVRSVVLGMHAALPDSLSAGHSMNDSAQGAVSGRRAYSDLVKFEKATGKHVYVLASHSHFYLEDVYNTACRKTQNMEVLPGWIVGTAGATWYRPPMNTSKVLPDVYGYLLGTVFSDGQIQFSFRQVSTSDVPAEVKARYGDLVDRCFSGNANNKSSYSPDGAASPPNCP